jgi:hypothetical protein
MANATIFYDRNTSLGAQVAVAMIELKSANDRLQTLLQVITQADGAALPGGIETGGAAAALFGVAAGQGAAFVADITGLAGALTVANRASLARLYRG